MSIPVIGIVGGVGSGKSTVARASAQHRQLVVIDADQIGHQVLELKPVKVALRERFGDSIFDSSGEIHRPTLGGLVFGTDPTHERNRLDLEAIVHPQIRQEIIRQIEAAQLAEDEVSDEAGKSHTDAVILDAAVLLESGWHEVCDDFVFIDTPLEQRLRNISNRGWDASELQRRESHQLSLEQKKNACRFVIDNSTTIDHACQQLIDILDSFHTSKTASTT